MLVKQAPGDLLAIQDKMERMAIPVLQEKKDGRDHQAHQDPLELSVLLVLKVNTALMEHLEHVYARTLKLLSLTAKAVLQLLPSHRPRL